MCVTSSMAAGWHQSQPLWVTWGPCRPGARAVHSPVGRRPGVQARDAQWRQMWRQDTQALRGRVGCCGSVNQMLQPCLPDLSAFYSPSSYNTPLPPSLSFPFRESAQWWWGSPECSVTLSGFQHVGMPAGPQAFIPEPPLPRPTRMEPPCAGFLILFLQGGPVDSLRKLQQGPIF